ncbi:hypothetical protein L227DRAFT_571438 [Lentinus tigrinus ALCF2SS1-6]|uniref:Uncharacterized protein n=1 Tax=Lentinus tigrinus ALCF2SS1-6 TaxID=1328759 RepID=A0A5C2SPG5_9APHY|nr:hypothetical protein L227DRAFT_571438 [Lentinus tigrinus ALCF2SS1-6]
MSLQVVNINDSPCYLLLLGLFFKTSHLSQEQHNVRQSSASPASTSGVLQGSMRFGEMENNGSADTAGGSSPDPPAPLGGHDSSQRTASPAIPAAVAVSLAIIAALLTWRCVVLFRRPDRVAALARLGFARRPRMFEVQPMYPAHISRDGSFLRTLLPLSVVKVSTGSDPTISLPPSMIRSTGRSTRVRPRPFASGHSQGHDMVEFYEMAHLESAPGQAASLQVAILIAMPMEGRRKAKMDSPNIVDELGEVHIGTMDAVCSASGHSLHAAQAR